MAAAGAFWIAEVKGILDATAAAPASKALAPPANERTYLKLFEGDRPPTETSRQLEDAIRESLMVPDHGARLPTIESLECRRRFCRIALLGSRGHLTLPS